MIGALVAAGTAVGMGVSAGWGRHRTLGALAGRAPDHVWFHVHPPHSDLWGMTPALECDGELLERFAAGLRTTKPLALALAAMPRPADQMQRSYAGFAALAHPMGRCVVGVSPEDAPLMPWAAAGCGLLARQLSGVLPATSGVASLASPPVIIDALPGWILGTDDDGAPVTVNLPPGSTVFITGDDAPGFVGTLPMTGRVINEDVTLVNASGEGQESSGALGTIATQWQDAWHPQTCRVIVSPGRADLPMDPGILADLTIDLDRGLLTSGGTQMPFRRLPSW